MITARRIDILGLDLTMTRASTNCGLNQNSKERSFPFSYIFGLKYSWFLRNKVMTNPKKLYVPFRRENNHLQ